MLRSRLFPIFAFLLFCPLCMAQGETQRVTGTRNYNLVDSTPPVGGKRRLASVEEEDVTPVDYNYSIGFEGAPAPSLLAPGAIAFGWWFDRAWGIETYFGFNKGAQNNATITATANNALTKTSTITTSYSGTNGGTTFTIGGLLKYAFFRNDWFQFYGGFLLALITPSKASYEIGSTTQSIANTDTPTNYTIADTGRGTTTSETSLGLALGPKLGTEFYLRWVPHLALGFATGILASTGSNVTTTTTARTQSYNVINGTPQPPGADSTTTTEVSTKPGFRASTFGIGGTQFQLTGIFTLRYEW